MTVQKIDLRLLTCSGLPAYALLDSGAGRKLERFGAILVDRPEAQALWQPRFARREWAKAHAVFSASGEDDEKGRWRVDKPVPESWPVAIERVTMLCKLLGALASGLVPGAGAALADGWWSRLAATRASRAPRVLNLFAYTGAASLLAAAAGARSPTSTPPRRPSPGRATIRRPPNLAGSRSAGSARTPRKFVAREVRRGRTYDADPGRSRRSSAAGPTARSGTCSRDLPALLADCVQLLAPAGAHMVLTAYAIRASALAFGQLSARRSARGPAASRGASWPSRRPHTI